jgi:DNA-3-methyladenine glycosylase II
MSYHLHLEKDRKLSKLINSQGVLKIRKRKNLFIYLCASITSQQLSTKVAEVIYNRFLGLYEGEEPSPQEVIDTPFDKLRSIGLSNNKAQYIQNVARFAIESGMDHKQISKMSNEEIIVYLTQIKGVGRWTVEMLLMFALGREDDLGIQNAMIGLYKLSRDDKKKFREDMLKISSRWSPYKTFACMHLWRWKDGE